MRKFVEISLAGGAGAEKEGGRDEKAEKGGAVKGKVERREQRAAADGSRGERGLIYIPTRCNIPRNSLTSLLTHHPVSFHLPRKQFISSGLALLSAAADLRGATSSRRSEAHLRAFWATIRWKWLRPLHKLPS